MLMMLNDVDIMGESVHNVKKITGVLRNKDQQDVLSFCDLFQ